MRRAFTLVEILTAVVLLGMMTTIGILTYRSVVSGWRVSRDYMDRLERTDYALDQLVSALKCACYPHNGDQTYDYGFQLTDNGDGDNPRNSDVIEWTTLHNPLIGGSATKNGVHRMQLRVLEEGDSTWGERIERTGLYCRVRPLTKIIPESTSGNDNEKFSFANDELYRPILIAKDVDGFNCRVQAEPSKDDKGQKKEDSRAFEDEFTASNAVPYKVQLTFYLPKEDPEFASRKIRIPSMRVVRLPLYEQSLDGATLPGKDKQGGKGSSGGGKRR